MTTCHAPRERVSWNHLDDTEEGDLTQSRSTWACELKWIIPTLVLQWSSHAPRERVSWNNEWSYDFRGSGRHAPRERVSWNAEKYTEFAEEVVTLHVSVWVEIHHT